ncbi:hypothetical protein ATK86_7485 [Nocardia fluminea]|uniref:HTH cro/C1-type domain-containing protein n=2 Tax=Nocardia fluminea TaxID=134984 RepID=A0A2N3V4J5_9NOCA|nr:hypothetical protein ATK86_7485 [Nocardia fluminea]
MSQLQLGREAGMSREVLANLESAAGDRPRVYEVPAVTTLVRLALALGVPPIELIYPELPDGPVEVWPDQQATSFQAVQWFSGESTAGDLAPDTDEPRGSNERLRLSRERERVRELVSGMGDAWISDRVRSNAERELRRSVTESIERVSLGMAELRSLMSRGGWQWGAGAGDVAQLEDRMRRAGMVVSDGDGDGDEATR